jgi:hypothetical protein
MKQSTGTTVSLVALIAIFIAMIGCGGGGGGSTTTNATTTTNTTTTNTTSVTAGGTTTAATTGTIGDLPADKIFFSQGFEPTTISYVDPDGANVTLFDTLPTNYSGYAPSPADNTVAFGYSPTGSGNPNYSLLRNTSVSFSGATTVAGPGFLFVSYIQFTPDGSQIIYVAQPAAGTSGLYVANADGTGTPLRLDDADQAALSPSGTVVVYSKFVGGDGELCRRNLDGTGFVQMTNNSAEDLFPQWSKDGLHVYFISDRLGSNLDIYSMDTDGLNVVHLLTTAVDEWGVSPNTAETEIAFTRVQPQNLAGVYKVSVGGSIETPLLVGAVNAFVYWTTTNGRSVGGSSASVWSESPRIRRLIQQRQR